jgi:hypothetical protein
MRCRNILQHYGPLLTAAHSVLGMTRSTPARDAVEPDQESQGPTARRLPREPAWVDSSPIVAFLRTFGISERTLATHVDDGSGHCAGCTWHESPRPIWPCADAFYAAAAVQPHHGAIRDG